ncbi:hypothetical protein KFL_003780040 [Klebsormidium nitens]|uniref:F-box domain-containing protein n=1 Tax=Klebsormidium nitens TaxID=105231 RepID=A0A1Y1II27_KLENI|nr:hypothetical protein KFL_003780040 [Klebsormidium nitens]|eukprot:GAQ87798.1 hypothetical protein KFL_003780040 [Klebsormidium nitens]
MSAMGGLCFESLNDDLACLVLEKLFPPNSVLFAFEGVPDLANFARVSRRYASVVRDSAWAAACRRVAPEVCADLVPVGGAENSPGEAGWMSFARLLTWCPGRLETPEKSRSGPFDCQAIRSPGKMHKCEPAKQHLCRTRFPLWRRCPPEASWQRKRKALPEQDASEKLGICPFCPSPVRRVPRTALKVTETTLADFRYCSSGHVVGIVEYRVGAYRQFWEISISEGDDERWFRGNGSVGAYVTSDLSNTD